MTFDFVQTAVQQTRRNMEGILDAFSWEQITAIPAGFNNNLLWNYGHVMVTQQLLCYRLAGLPTKVEADLIDRYRKGTAPDPDHPASREEYDQLRQLSADCLAQFAEDYAQGRFSEPYQPYATSYGISLTSIEEAFYFNLGHEALHLGTMLAMRKLV
jgi:hypothetical protein